MLKGILKKKLNNDKGFTLAELLIVVAIIAILVAVSIPVFTSRLEEAKKSTDVANIRAAKAAAVNLSLSGDANLSDTYYYDADNGILRASADKSKITKGYGKSSGVDGATGTPKDNILQVTFDSSDNNKVVLKWVSVK